MAHQVLVGSSSDWCWGHPPYGWFHLALLKENPEELSKTRWRQSEEIERAEVLRFGADRIDGLLSILKLNAYECGGDVVVVVITVHV